MEKDNLTIPYFEESKNALEDGYSTFFCNTQRGKKGDAMASAHWHDYVELIYLLEGKVTASLNGRIHTVQKGEMIVINSRDVHAVWSQADTEYVIIQFDPEILYTSAHSILETRYVLPCTTKNNRRQHVFSQKDSGMTDLHDLVLQTLTEFKDRKYGFELAVKSNICRIFLGVLRAWKSTGEDGSQNIELKEKDIVRLNKVISLLDQQYMNSITAEEMAFQCNMSYCYFSRFFKMAAGRSFTRYLNEIRLSEAEKLLISTDKSVTEVAMETGFSSISYFISQFRESRRLSPQQFRRKLKESALQQDDYTVLRTPLSIDQRSINR